MSLWRVFTSTLAAFIGIQTETRRQQDFNTSSPIPFIIMGIVLAIALILVLMFIVDQILS
ncbi:DUF2970 domain-containing protein [Shewanella intestini]|uniref:DUF2970 domain-containing protein n=1 Tax=Shewanella intestini TaxID=2017544 RepID=A0ABS5I271_9GAMM|nr:MULTISPECIES: DUF2970 domain-containing protein [Shewanella]MBR9728126.1 DUF2970 domain-containing protein [Shewanella intestini]MRG36597.1 DUF2970 domain-containing protein [Shewanella sp. XMDDZSB0408]